VKSNILKKGGVIMFKLKEYRENKRLSQREIAKYLEITQASYWNLEKENTTLNAKQIIKLCKLYECTPNDLLGVKGVHQIVFNEMDKEK
jgi:transcriptional regulator with XRE-family HTH domain